MNQRERPRREQLKRDAVEVAGSIVSGVWPACDAPVTAGVNVECSHSSPYRVCVGPALLGFEPKHEAGEKQVGLTRRKGEAMHCPSCSTELSPGTRWCQVCHSNVVQPAAGKLASPGKRLGAYVLDGAIPWFVILGSLGVGAGVSGGDGGVGGGVMILLLLGYAAWALMLFSRGTTPGKNLLGMRVIKESGESAGFGTMLFREWIGKIISAFVFGIGFLWILLDKERQGWHDKLASTYVVG